MDKRNLQNISDHFISVMEQQLSRLDKIKNSDAWINYTEVTPIIIGMIGGDGIGPIISDATRYVLEELLSEEKKSGKILFRDIKGLTIENRASVGKAIPDDVLEEIKKCHVTLKGPTHTPEKGDPWPNIESANVAMRKELDLFANVRPVRIPIENIDWTFFRENTEDLYAVGSQGINVTDDLAVDFRIISSTGSTRIIEAAFAHAQRTEKSKVTVVTKANVVKTTDGKFLEIAKEVASRYPNISWDAWYIDIMTAKLLDPKRRNQFEVLVMPNLYGDILTDEAAEIQGGVGTAGSANIGKSHAMFEAIHGSAPRMVKEGRAQYADPSSLLRAGAMLLDHIGFTELGNKLNKAIDICGMYEKRFPINGRESGSTSEEYGQYILETIKNPELNAIWDKYSNG